MGFLTMTFTSLFMCSLFLLPFCHFRISLLLPCSTDVISCSQDLIKVISCTSGSVVAFLRFALSFFFFFNSNVVLFFAYLYAHLLRISPFSSEEVFSFLLSIRMSFTRSFTNFPVLEANK